MPTFLDILWDDDPGGNVEHLDEHGVSPEEAASVLRRFFDDREPGRSRPRYWVVMGDTDAGRFLIVVFEYLDDLRLVIPVTAYEPEGLED